MLFSRVQEHNREGLNEQTRDVAAAMILAWLFRRTCSCGCLGMCCVAFLRFSHWLNSRIHMTCRKFGLPIVQRILFYILYVCKILILTSGLFPRPNSFGDLVRFLVLNFKGIARQFLAICRNGTQC